MLAAMSGWMLQYTFTSPVRDIVTERDSPGW